MFETKKVAGSATCEQGKTVWNWVVLYCQFVYSVCSVMKTKEFVNVVVYLFQFKFDCQNYIVG